MSRRPVAGRLGMAARAGLIAAGLLGFGLLQPARAQQLDLSHGGPVEITASDGIEWHQDTQTIIARGDARAVRGDVTVTADVLIAHYRKKACTPAPGTAAPGAEAAAGAATRVSATVPAPAAASSPAQPPPPPCPPAPAAGSPAASPTALPGASPTDDTGDNEIYRLEAEGHVHIYTQTDQAQGDHAVYDIDQAVLVLTGHDLKLTTPTQVMTARDSMEWWSQKHMGVGRGDAVVVTSDGRRIAADVLVGYTTDPNAPPAPGAPPPPKPKPAATPAAPGAATGSAPTDPLMASGKLQRVEAFGHVVLRTQVDTVRGDRGVYVPDTSIARVAGHVRITRGDNELNGNEAETNLKTGISRLISAPGTRVEGLVVPQGGQPTGGIAAGATSGAPKPAAVAPATPAGSPK
jgi:lipopolysaccharide export system protein LptA